MNDFGLLVNNNYQFRRTKLLTGQLKWKLYHIEKRQISKKSLQTFSKLGHIRFFFISKNLDTGYE